MKDAKMDANLASSYPKERALWRTASLKSSVLSLAFAIYKYPKSVVVRDWDRDGAEGGLGGGGRLRGCRRWIGRRQNGRWDERVERKVRCE